MHKKTPLSSVALIGIGRVGLPMALVLANEGYKVYGIGRDQIKMDALKKGIMPFLEKDAPELLKKWANKRFFPTTSYESIKDSDIIILTLGTPIDENMNPVLSQIDEAFAKAMPFLKKGQLIILRSTVSPRTTQYVEEIINNHRQFKVGKNIFLAFCPERIAEGAAIKEIKEIPQIIGGTDRASTKKAKDFFESFGVKCIETDATSAELAKLFTNMYRYISFAIANEFMVIAENFNKSIYEIVDLVNKDYKRGGLSLPGLTAGPCLFKDGFFLINDFPFIDLVATSWKINESMPLFLIDKIKERINLKHKKVALLGISFKPEIDDIRESLSIKIRKSLLREHAHVLLHDPFVKQYAHQPISDSLDDTLKDAQVLIVAVRHKMYESHKEQILKMVHKNTLICDIWNIFGTNKILFRANTV